ncbi:MAG: hypothetical protein ACRBN8_19280 [Nannocystales bacterium]
MSVALEVCLASSSHRITLNGSLATVALAGRLVEEDATAFGRQVWELLAEADPSVCVLFDLTKLESCQLLARPALIELQRRIKAGKRRTAWFATRPRFRGLALLVCHEANDTRASVVTTLEQAQEWFAGKGLREDAAKRVARRLAEIKAGGSS